MSRDATLEIATGAIPSETLTGTQWRSTKNFIGGTLPAGFGARKSRRIRRLLSRLVSSMLSPTKHEKVASALLGSMNSVKKAGGARRLWPMLQTTGYILSAVTMKFVPRGLSID